MFNIFDINVLHKKCRTAFLRGNSFVKKIIRKYWNIIMFLFYSCDISIESDIADSVHFGYNAIGIVIHKNAVIGQNCQIMQNVTIGGKSGGVPVIEDSVLISAGAVLIGGIRIGEGAVIGANAVVLTDVPKGTVYAGVPAKRIDT